jgi:hypothetical protein
MPSWNGVNVFNWLFTRNGIPYMREWSWKSFMPRWNGVNVFICLVTCIEWNPLLYMSHEAESHTFRVGMESNVFSRLVKRNGILYLRNGFESHACQVREWSQCIQFFSYVRRMESITVHDWWIWWIWKSCIPSWNGAVFSCLVKRDGILYLSDGYERHACQVRMESMYSVV